MKKTILAVAVILGLGVTGFSQTSNEEIILVDETTGEIMSVFIQNENVTIVPGEEIIIYNNGTDKQIAVKGNGEFVGESAGTQRVYTELDGLMTRRYIARAGR